MDDKLAALGTKLYHKFEQYEGDRQPLEQQWLKNFRQFRGVYDGDILSKIAADRSKVYPLDTQVKVLGFIAKVMELMFPASEKNWSVMPSPVPDIQHSDVQAIVDGLQQRNDEEKLQAAQQAQEQGQDPKQAVAAVPGITDAQIERAVYRFAEDRARAMERECEDQLSEVGYTAMARKALRSGGVYGYGVTKGPQVEFRKRRSWKFDEAIGGYRADTTSAPVPIYGAVKVWDIYPDLSAKDWDAQEGLFERIVFSRNDLYGLAEDKAFDGASIRKYLRENPEGNYKARSYETELANVRKGDMGFKEISGRHYEVICWYGFSAAKDVSEAGIELEDKGDLERDVLMDIWMLGDLVIRANEAPFGEIPSDMYHAFIAEDDEEVGITGVGLPEKLRDTQMKLCSVDRMTMDNAAVTAGPILEVNDDLIKRGQDTESIHGFKVIHREGDGPEAQYPAVREINVQNQVPGLISLRDKFESQMDVESNLPSFLFGNTQGMGEAFRTTSNMSMLQGGAMMVTKDTIRSFDKWVESIIRSLYEWNMEFSDKENIKGDFAIVARGTSSLVAKELRGIALDQFMTTLDEDEKQLLNRREVLIDRLQARDLPVDRVVSIEEADQIIADIRARDNAIAQSAIAKDNASTALDQADAGLKTTQAEVLMEKSPVDNAATVAGIHDTRVRTADQVKRTELQGDKQSQEAVSDLLTHLSNEDQLAASSAEVA